jgi:steroid 5-alpha reductase family enzyme
MNPALHAALGLAGWAALLAFTLFLVAWLIQQKTSNAGYVDVAWTYNLGLIAVLYAWLGPATGLRKWVFAGMVVIWSLRLGTHVLVRVIGKPEEGRYKQLRGHWKTATGAKFFAFFEGQTLLDVVLSLPILLVCVAGSGMGDDLGPLQIAGVALWLVAQIGEAVADAQLSSCKRKLKPGQVCDTGLWKYSRHPNYFFEWLIWVGWALFALDSPLGWMGFLSPALMLLFLYRVTGIPWTEAQSLRSKGVAYREYQKTTSEFFPWFPKHPEEQRHRSGSEKKKK